MVTFPSFLTRPSQKLATDSFDSEMFGGNYTKGRALLDRAGSIANTGIAIYSNRVRSGMAANSLMNQSMWKDLQANQIETNATEQSNAIREQLLNNMASTNALFAGRGFDVGSAGAMNIRSRRNAMNDVLNTQDQSRLDAISKRSEASSLRTDASISRTAGKYQRAGMKGDLVKQGMNFFSGLRGLLNE